MNDEPIYTEEQREAVLLNLKEHELVEILRDEHGYYVYEDSEELYHDVKDTGDFLIFRTEDEVAKYTEQNFEPEGVYDLDEVSTPTQNYIISELENAALEFQMGRDEYAIGIFKDLIRKYTNTVL